jgi:hypothetical protein
MIRLIRMENINDEHSRERLQSARNPHATTELKKYQTSF